MERKGNSTMISLILGGVIVIGVAIFLILLFKSTTKETQITLSDNSLVIDGMYGDTFNYSDITSVELKDTIPVIKLKTNGAWLGESKKGYFDLEGMGKCLLFSLSDSGPFVYINADGQYIIINYEDKSKTEQLYKDLSEKVKR
jgi:hypothetical protein